MKFSPHRAYKEASFMIIHRQKMLINYELIQRERVRRSRRSVEFEIKKIKEIEIAHSEFVC